MKRVPGRISSIKRKEGKSMHEIPVVSVKKMRECDAATINKLGDSRILMYRAGEAVVEEMVKEHLFADWKIDENDLRQRKIRLKLDAAPSDSVIPDDGKRVAIVCGTGNNAGDGYVIAQILTKMGIGVKLYLMEERFSQDGRYYFDQCAELGVEHCILENGADGFTNAKIIVDCIYGTGYRGELCDRAKNIIDGINRSGAYVVSVDMNSGMNGDIGVEGICVRSDLTVSIGFFKKAHVMSACKEYMRKLVNANIGIVLPEGSRMDEESGIDEESGMDEGFGSGEESGMDEGSGSGEESGMDEGSEINEESGMDKGSEMDEESGISEKSESTRNPKLTKR